jgi:hypothetical protein
VTAVEGLELGLLICADHVLVGAQLGTVPGAGVEIEHPDGLGSACSAADRTTTKGLDGGIGWLSPIRAPACHTTRRAGVIRPAAWENTDVAVKFPESTKASLHHRLLDRVEQRSPQLAQLHMRHALDLACGLYLGDPTAWHDLRPPTN